MLYLSWKSKHNKHSEQLNQIYTPVMVNFLKYCKERKLAENWLVRKRENLTRDRILTSTCKLLVVIALRLLFCCCGKQCTLVERRNQDRTACLMCGISLCILRCAFEMAFSVSIKFIFLLTKSKYCLFCLLLDYRL